MAKKEVLGNRKILKPAGLIDQMGLRIEAVKRKHSIVDVFKYYGVDLKPTGTDGEYMSLLQKVKFEIYIFEKIV